jgi:hypothetical protein
MDGLAETRMTTDQCVHSAFELFHLSFARMLLHHTPRVFVVASVRKLWSMLNFGCPIAIQLDFVNPLRAVRHVWNWSALHRLDERRFSSRQGTQFLFHHNNAGPTARSHAARQIAILPGHKGFSGFWTRRAEGLAGDYSMRAWAGYFG